MATIRRKENGSYLGRWRTRSGDLHEEATGCYDMRKAQRLANQREAIARFWEEHEAGAWATYAALGFSPRYCHESFIARGFMRFDRFRELLKEAGIKFKPASQWRDRIARPPKHSKRYKFCGKLRTVHEIIELSRSHVTASVLRWRLGQGWSMEEALSTPKLSRAEVASRGAQATNARRRASS